MCVYYNNIGTFRYRSKHNNTLESATVNIVMNTNNIVLISSRVHIFRSSARVYIILIHVINRDPNNII